MRRAQLDPPRRPEKPHGGAGPRQQRVRDKDRQPRQKEARPPIPEISAESVKERLSNLNDDEAIFQLDLSRDSGGREYSARRLQPAPKIPQGYQPQGGFVVHGAPPDLPDQAFVLVTEEEGKSGRFKEVIGRFPQRGDDRRDKRGPRRR